MLNPRSKMPIDWESTLQEAMPDELKSAWEARSTDFRNRRDDIVQLVREGEMTLKAARHRTAEMAAELIDSVESMVRKQKSKTPVLSRKLAESSKSLSRNDSPEESWKKTVELLMKNLTELQIANRKEEFETKTYVKSSAHTVPAPSIDQLFVFLHEAHETGDQPAVEWSRRQLERLREFVPDESIKDRIDEVCDRPGVLNRRLIGKYRDGIAPRMQEPGFVEALLAKAIEVTDANACAAIFEIARKSPESMKPETLDQIAASIDRFPETAMRFSLRTDREALKEEALQIERFRETCLEWLDRASALEDVRQPTESESRLAERPKNQSLTATDEPIGLAMPQRGGFAGNLDSESSGSAENPGVVIA
jgi:hypothetical protein